MSIKIVNYLKQHSGKEGVVRCIKVDDILKIGIQTSNYLIESYFEFQFNHNRINLKIRVSNFFLPKNGFFQKCGACTCTFSSNVRICYAYIYG